ncbi:MAG: TetR/AcrR family transcriptional regulator [Pleurocapsa sp. SU_5_0]|nr:TetR/AcrR family transcriptional regulator [Pleurocapsa sp. SU_5_0]
MPAPKIDKAKAIAAIAELFREHGYHGTSYAQIIKASGLGKGSLYHYFPGGKEDIAKAVLRQIDCWFEENIFAPLDTNNKPEIVLGEMFTTVDTYFASGQRICLLGSFALYDAKEPFSSEIKSYFQRWIQALSSYLQKQGLSAKESHNLACGVMVAIQGGLVMAQAIDDTDIFRQAIFAAKSNLLKTLNV